MADVIITFEGIMILSFNQTARTCTIGVPPTDERHEFLLMVKDSGGMTKEMLIRKRASIALVDSSGQRPADVSKPATFFNTVIDFGSAKFHPGFTFRTPYKHRHRLQINNGTFDVVAGSVVSRATFKRNGTLHDTRDVARKVKLTIPVGAGQQVIFSDNGGSINLEPSSQIDIINICPTVECLNLPPDFLHYYNALNIGANQQMVPDNPPFSAVGGSTPDQSDPILFSRKFSPGLPCWLGGYDEPPGPNPPPEG